jgi:ABC-type transporter Mla MlaB component
VGALNIEYAFEKDGATRYLCMKVLNATWGSGEMISVFSEVAEAMVGSSYQNLCFDLSALTVVPSSAFGGCMNIIESAQAKSKNVKFRLDEEAMETARLSGLADRVKIEVRA